MTKLFLKFKDENDEEKRVAIEKNIFTVGRHSESDMTVADSRLSREHIRIERDGGDFVVSDRGSSNGTLLNGENLKQPAVLKDGDTLNLGGGLEIVIELVSAPAAAAADAATEKSHETYSVLAPAPPLPATVSAPESNSLPVRFFVIAPLLGIGMLALVIGLIFVFSGDRKPAVADGDGDFIYSTDPDASPSDTKESASKPASNSPTLSADREPRREPSESLPQANNQTLSQNATETAKVEQNGSAFLRRIAQNEPTAFLTGHQAQRVNVKIKQVGRSSSLTDNINSARKSASQIRSLAASKNLKPQFLAVATIARLGNNRGNVVQTAQSIAEVYDKLDTQIGGEGADDALLLVAAFDQGAAGDFMKMRNMLQSLAGDKKIPEDSRTIRTIWFLEKNNKITQAEFENALNFLAIGTITQNPKDFGVKAEALIL